MQTPTINVTYNMLLAAIKRLYLRKEITLNQYAASLRRSLKAGNDLPKETTEITQITTHPQKVRPMPSGDFPSFLKKLGVGYIS